MPSGELLNTVCQYKWANKTTQRGQRFLKGTSRGSQAPFEHNFHLVLLEARQADRLMPYARSKGILHTHVSPSSTRRVVPMYRPQP